MRVDSTLGKTCRFYCVVNLRKSKQIAAPFVFDIDFEVSNDEILNSLYEILLFRNISLGTTQNIQRPLKKSEIKEYARIYIKPLNKSSNKKIVSANLAKLKDPWTNIIDSGDVEEAEMILKVCFYPMNGNSSLVIA